MTTFLKCLFVAFLMMLAFVAASTLFVLGCNYFPITTAVVMAFVFTVLIALGLYLDKTRP